MTGVQTCALPICSFKIVGVIALADAIRDWYEGAILNVLYFRVILPRATWGLCGSVDLGSAE